MAGESSTTCDDETKQKHLPSPLLPILQERAITIDHTLPLPASYSTAIPPSNIRNLIRLLFPPSLHLLRLPPSSLPHKLRKRTSSTPEIFLPLILRHPTRQHPPYGNHSRRMRADQKAFGTIGIRVRSRNKMMKRIRQPIVELRYTLPFRTWDANRVLLCVQVREMRIQHFDTSR